MNVDDLDHFADDAVDCSTTIIILSAILVVASGLALAVLTGALRRSSARPRPGEPPGLHRRTR